MRKIYAHTLKITASAIVEANFNIISQSKESMRDTLFRKLYNDREELNDIEEVELQYEYSHARLGREQALDITAYATVTYEPFRIEV